MRREHDDPTPVEEPARGTVEYAELAGWTLHDLLGDAGLAADVDITLSRAFHAAGRAVRALHSAPAPPGLGDHRPADEVDVTARWVDHALAHGVLGGDQRARAAAALTLVRRGLGAAGAPPALTLVHRDLHDKQIVVAGGHDAGVLDLDTLAVDDPALDMANLLVHLELRALQGHCRAEVAAAAGAALVAGYGPDRALVGRLGAYAASTRLRLACVYAFRPHGLDLGTCLLDGV